MCRSLADKLLQTVGTMGTLFSAHCLSRGIKLSMNLAVHPAEQLCRVLALGKPDSIAFMLAGEGACSSCIYR